MKIHVDLDACDLHGQCVFAAPDLFWFDDAGELQYRSEADDGLAPSARSAASLCPAAAIAVTT
jgi:ferredoxin